MAISSQDVVIDQQPILIQGGNSTAVKVDGSAVTQPVSGTVTATQATGTNLHVVTDATSTTIATQATGSNLHTVTDSGSTTTVTGNVTVVQPTGTNLHAVLDATSTTTVTQATGTNLHTVVDSGTITANQGTSPWVVSGTVTTTQPTSSSDTVTQVTSTGANQTLLAANANRKKAILFFESGTWNVKFGATASSSSKTYMITSNNTTIEVDIWVGIIDAICTTAGKLVDVTEMV